MIQWDKMNETNKGQIISKKIKKKNYFLSFQSFFHVESEDRKKEKFRQ